MKQFLRSLKGLSLLSILLTMANFVANATNYYTAANGDPTNRNNWWTNTNGTGSHPSNFTTSGNTFTIQAGHVMTTTANWTISGTGSSLVIYGTLVASNTVTANSMTVNNGGVYQHNVDGGTIPAATWNTGSTCSITGNSGVAPSGLNPTGGFANFIWNSPGQSSFDNVSLAGNLKTINGNFSVISTGLGSLRLMNSGGTVTLTVGGNFSQTGGNFYILGSGANFSTSSMTMNVAGSLSLSGGTLIVDGATATNFSSNAGEIDVAGDFNVTGGTLTETANSGYTSNIYFDGTGVQTYTSGATVTNTVNFTVNSGATLQMGSGASPSTMSGGGTFTLSSNGGLEITSSAGITSSGATGNIQVTGTRSYNAGASYIYEGASTQVTGNGLPPTIANLYIQTSNSAKVNLTGALAITGSLRLISGTVDASTNSLTMNSGSTISGGSSSSYVVTGNGSGNGGLTINNLNTLAKVFPIGTLNYYLPATVQPAAGSTGLNWTAKVFTPATTNGAYSGTAFDAASLANMINAIWTVSHSTATGTAALTLDWTSATALEGSNFAASPAASYGISHYNGSTWDAAVQTASTTTSVTYSSFNNFSPFGVGIVGDPLPMILVDFNAVMDNNKTVDLSWTTEMEQNSSHFNVLRSADGSSWSAIGVVQAKGNSSIASNYSFTDQSPLSSINYYRLQMVDLDGKYSYSEIKVVKTSLINGLSIFPNPAKDYINVSVGGSSSSLTIRLINQSGQILQEKIVNSASSSVVSMPVYSYPQGNYYLQVTSADGSQQTSKILITR